jgi:WD40 repeat protein
VHEIAYSPDGSLIAVGHSNGVALIRANGDFVASLIGHNRDVLTLRFSRDGSLLATAGVDTVVRLWDVATRSLVGTFRGHNDFISAVVFSPDGALLATAGRDRTVRLWDVATRTQLAVLNGHTDWITSLSVNRDGTLLASGCHDTTIRLWNVASRSEVAVLRGHTNGVTSVSFSPDGRTLASGSADVTVRLWDVASGAELATMNGHEVYVTSVSFSPDGRTLASGAWDFTVRLWDTATRKERGTLGSHTDFVYSVAFNPRGRFLASGGWDGVVRLWELPGDVGTPVRRAWDVNNDGRVDILDLVVIAVAFGQSGAGLAGDVNQDGTVDIADLVTTAAHFGEIVGFVADSPVLPNARQIVMIESWLKEARRADNGSDLFRRGIAALERLYTGIVPERSALLPNYPNPFNPETWLPFDLSASGEVTLVLYDIRGRVVRRLELGVLRAGLYRTPSHAARWDGRDAFGERVGNGVYFVEFRANGYREMRRLAVGK